MLLSLLSSALVLYKSVYLHSLHNMLYLEGFLTILALAAQTEAVPSWYKAYVGAA